MPKPRAALGVATGMLSEQGRGGVTGTCYADMTRTRKAMAKLLQAKRLKLRIRFLSFG